MFQNKFIAIILLAVIFSGCSTSSSDDALLSETPKASQFNDRNNKFGLELFQQLNHRKNEQENMVLSPVSVSMALGMTYNGTAGETRQRLTRVLGWQGMSEDEVNQYHKRLIHYYNNQTSDISLNIANGIWYNESLNVYQRFLSANNEYFSAYHNNFNRETTPQDLNEWVRRQTGGHIKEVIDEFHPEDLLYLVNATYFKGDWKNEFNASKTSESMFFLEDGTKKRTQMMWQKADLKYHDNDSFQIVELPYKNDSFCMYILLPDSTKNVNDLIASLNFETWVRYKSNLEVKRNINFGMPRFRCDYSVGMKELMRTMGVEDLFDENSSNLSNISDQPLSVSEVMHKAAIDVDEQGTEATAATSLAISFTTLVDDNPFNLVVNRPFVFAIEEKASNSLLFIGKINNP